MLRSRFLNLGPNKGQLYKSRIEGFERFVLVRNEKTPSVFTITIENRASVFSTNIPTHLINDILLMFQDFKQHIETTPNQVR